MKPHLERHAVRLALLTLACVLFLVDPERRRRS